MAHLPKRRYRLGSDPVVRRVHSTWYRGPGSSFAPSAVNLREPGALFDYVLKGWVPSKPLAKADSNIVAVGSCFAQHSVGYLRRARGGKNVHLFAFGGGFNNTFTLRKHFEWALGEVEVDRATLFLEDRNTPVGNGMYKFKLVPVKAAQAVARKRILEGDLFFVSLGVAEVWCDAQTEEPLFGSVPYGMDLFADWDSTDQDRHLFRLSSVDENVDNIRAIYQSIKTVRPNATIVFAVCPARMLSTFRPVPCLTANSASKAVLRVALDVVLREELPGMYYWPAYEVVTDLYGPRGYNQDQRHVRTEVIERLGSAFARHFLGWKKRSPKRRASAQSRQ